VAVAFGAGPVVDAAGFELPAESVLRTSDYLQHPVFNTHRSETQLLRYIRKLSDRDLALDRTMIPLGSCTMKLNATAEMEAISWPEFASIHPFAPDSQTAGWRELISGPRSRPCRDHRLRPGVHPAQRRFPGRARRPAGDPRLPPLPRRRAAQRLPDPASAHGTNAASAVLAGMKVVVVATAADGTIDHADLHRQDRGQQGRPVGIMITYPSTHGVYDADVREVCDAIHAPAARCTLTAPTSTHSLAWPSRASSAATCPT
jgi:glycine dehydrogenase